MVDPNVEYGIVEDNQGFLSLESPFLDFQFNPEDTAEQYVNWIMFLITKNVELFLRIHDLQDWVPMHPKLQAF